MIKTSFFTTVNDISFCVKIPSLPWQLMFICEYKVFLTVSKQGYQIQMVFYEDGIRCATLIIQWY